MDDIHDKWCACSECMERKMKGRENGALTKSNKDDTVVTSKGE